MNHFNLLRIFYNSFIFFEFFIFCYMKNEESKQSFAKKSDYRLFVDLKIFKVIKTDK